MKKILVLLVAAAAAWPVSSTFYSEQTQPIGGMPHNIVIFVFDGLRGGSVNATDAPTMDWIRNHGVSFVNSHSLFPTVTTANASAIATGHFLGDTGDFGNSIYSGFPVATAGGIVTPFIQDNPILAELNQHHGGNFIAERTLMQAAREKGYLTAALGKVGPVGI